MNKLITTLCCTLTFVACFGQLPYEPQIIILSPNEMIYSKVFEKEIANYNKEIKERLNQAHHDTISGEMNKQPENMKIMMQNEIAFSQTLDFSKQTTFIAEQYLAYRFFEKFPNLLITLKDIKCTEDITALKKVSDEQHLQYVLNFPKIEFYKQSRISYARIRVQLYDQSSNTILLDKVYIGDWNNPGFEFTCKDHSLECTISNVLAQALEDIIEIVAINSPTLRKEKILAQERFAVLINDYYLIPFDTSFLRKIIPSNDSSINYTSLYQCLIDESKTKFIAFFLEKSRPQDFKSLNDDKTDKFVDIISDKEMKDPGFFDDVPQRYAYIVKGVKYLDKWYYQKANVTYFEAFDMEEGKQQYFNNLQRWNFFRENLAESNPEFWETNLFKKVEEGNNKGLYKIVADRIREDNLIVNEAFRKQISEVVFQPFYENYKKDNASEFKEYSIMYDKLTLIFPITRKVALNPILITDEKGYQRIRYFFFLVDENKIYEWTYLEPKIREKTFWHYGSDIIEQLSVITTWNFGYDTLDDQTFWDNYVLIKTADQYKYLKEVR